MTTDELDRSLRQLRLERHGRRRFPYGRNKHELRASGRSISSACSSMTSCSDDATGSSNAASRPRISRPEDAGYVRLEV